MLTTVRWRAALTEGVAIIVVLLTPVDSAAQLNGQNIKGDAGQMVGAMSPA